jgi:hypothetical protein
MEQVLNVPFKAKYAVMAIAVALSIANNVSHAVFHVPRPMDNKPADKIVITTHATVFAYLQ